MSQRTQHSTTRQLILEKETSEKWGINLGVGSTPPFPVTIRDIKPNSAASRSDLKKDDRVTSVNGTYTLGLSKDKIYALFGGNIVRIEYTTPLQPNQTTGTRKSNAANQKKLQQAKKAGSNPPNGNGKHPQAHSSTSASHGVREPLQRPQTQHKSYSANQAQIRPQQASRSSTLPSSSYTPASRSPQTSAPSTSHSILPASGVPTSAANVYRPSVNIAQHSRPVLQSATPSRPASQEVIDLVSSDDEESEPVLPQRTLPASSALPVARSNSSSRDGNVPTTGNFSHRSSLEPQFTDITPHFAHSPRNLGKSTHDVIELLDDSDDGDDTEQDFVDEEMDMLNSLLSDVDENNRVASLTAHSAPQPPPPQPPPPHVNVPHLPATALSSSLPPPNSVTDQASTVSSQPSLKKRRLSASKDAATSGGDHLFCGVKVKLEPVGFGCADDMEVVEVLAPVDEEKEAVIGANIANNKVAGPPSSTKAASMDEDDDISYVGGNMTTMLEMPHARESCSVYPFVRKQPGSVLMSSSANMKYCDYCYCYVCECKASECLYWSSHAQATHKNVIWKMERALLRSKVLLLLNPPKRRAAFIEHSLKPKIMDSPAMEAKYSFNKVLDGVKLSLTAIIGTKVESSVNENTSSDFLEAVILLINIIKKCQNEIREGSVAHRAMLYLSQALLSTNMFSAPFASPEMGEAIREDLSSLSNSIAVEFVKVLLQLTVPNETSRLRWVQDSRLGSRLDVPAAVGKLKSIFVAGVFFKALQDVQACPVAVLEFCSRQGDKLIVQCFYWLVDVNDISLASLAIDRIPKSNFRRELCQFFVAEKQGGKKMAPKHILKYCTLLAVLGRKYDSYADDLLSFYASRMFRAHGAVHEQSAAFFNKNLKSQIESSQMIDYMQLIERAVDTDATGVASLARVPPGITVHALYYLLLQLPCFSHNAVLIKPQQVKRFVTQVVFKDATAECTLLFLYYFQAWGAMGDNIRSTAAVAENITTLSCEIARDIIARDKSLLLTLPIDILQRWSAMANECNLSQVFVPVSFHSNGGGLRPSLLRTGSLKNASLSSYVPLHTFASIPNLKEKMQSHLELLMAIMWKSVVVTGIDYIMNPNHHKMSLFVHFMRSLQDLGMDESLSVMLKDAMLMLLFFEAASSHHGTSGTNDTDDYKLTQLLRRIVRGLKKTKDNDQGRWLFWQALLSQILQKVVGENKYDILNFIIIEDWTTLSGSYFSDQGSSIHSHRFKALTNSVPSDIDVKQKDSCVYVWQRIHTAFPSLINTLASESEPNLIHTLLYHAPEFIADITPIPSVFRIIQSIVKAPDVASVPSSIIENLQSQWGCVRALAEKNLDNFVGENTPPPTQADVLMCIVLNLQEKFARLFPKLTSLQDVIKLFNQTKSMEETLFLVDNSIVTLRQAILTNSTFKQQLTIEFQQFEYFDILERLSSLAMIEIMAILFPTVKTITTFMSHKDKFDGRLVADVFSHFQQLLTNDFEGSCISIADAFLVYTQYADEKNLESFFFNLYCKRMNPLDEKFIANCFSHIQKVGRDKGGRILSWLVTFCYRFHQDMNRTMLFSLQKIFLEFLNHMDFNDFNLTESTQSSTQLKDESDTSVEAPRELTASDVYSTLTVVGEEDLILLHPKFAFNFLQLIIFPQTEKYDVLPVDLLSPSMKRITLHFLFDIELPVVFISTALRRQEFSCLNEKIVDIPFENQHWPVILQTLLTEIHMYGMHKARHEDDSNMPAKSARGGRFPGSEFVLHSMELLMKFQAMITRNENSSVVIIKDIFNLLNGLLSLQTERSILKNIISFKAASVLSLVEETTSVEEVDQMIFNLISKLCFLTSTAKWCTIPDMVRKYSELMTLQFEVEKRQGEGDGTTSSWSKIVGMADFRVPLKVMLRGVFPQTLNLLEDVSTNGESAYVLCLQSLISCVRNGSIYVIESLLPFVSECLDSKFLGKAMTSFHLTSGYLTTTLWVQFINDLSLRLPHPDHLRYMSFLCEVASSLHNLTSSSFAVAVNSAAQNGLTQKWLSVLLELVTVHDLAGAQAVASFLFSIPKTGDNYVSDFWHQMYSKLKDYDIPSMAMAICTEGRCKDQQFMSSLTSHEEILPLLTVELDPASLLESKSHGLYALWGALVKQEGALVVEMMNKVVLHLLSERLSGAKKVMLANFLSKMKNLYFLANKFENWRIFCQQAAMFATKKKPLVLILNDAMSASF